MAAVERVKVYRPSLAAILVWQYYSDPDAEKDHTRSIFWNPLWFILLAARVSVDNLERTNPV